MDETILAMKIAQETAALPVSRQAEVLDFVRFLKQREIEATWDAIPDREAEIVQAEFAAEDHQLAESAAHDYLALLRREDEL
ncbi:MAG: hypothetical protein KGJ80_16660 [Chloroflexota bacterium]|nr:hypothetical protein [Chloroflexota bacterium]